MLIKLAALGALGYAGYTYYRKTMGEDTPRTPALSFHPEQRAIAGGPLSSQARLIHPGEDLPGS